MLRPDATSTTWGAMVLVQLLIAPALNGVSVQPDRLRGVLEAPFTQWVAAAPRALHDDLGHIVTHRRCMRSGFAAALTRHLSHAPARGRVRRGAALPPGTGSPRRSERQVHWPPHNESRSRRHINPKGCQLGEDRGQTRQIGSPADQSPSPIHEGGRAYCSWL